MGAYQDGAGRIGSITESTCPAQYRAKTLAFLQAIAAGVCHLAIEHDRGADIVPPRQLVNGENVARLKRDRAKLIRVDVKRRAFTDDFLPVLNGVARQVGAAEQGIPLEATRHVHQLHGGHIEAERIGAGAQDFTTNRYLRGVHFIAAQYADGVKGLERQVGIADQGIGHIELNGLRMKIRGDQPYQVAFGSGLRQ